MGRGRNEGQKNLVKMLDNPRYVRVFFARGSQRLPSSMLVSAASYERIIAGFERRGYTVAVSESEVAK